MSEDACVFQDANHPNKIYFGGKVTHISANMQTFVKFFHLPAWRIISATSSQKRWSVCSTATRKISTFLHWRRLHR